MKKFILIVFVASLCACSKSSNSSSSVDVASAITGNWLAGSETDTYYKSGALVYTKNVAAVPKNQYGSYYYTFNGGVAGTYEWNTSKAAYVKFNSTDSYTLTNNNQTLNYISGGSTTISYTLTVVDANTITLSEDRKGTISYTKTDNTTAVADEGVWTYTYTKF